jgi:hypothetical protein
MEVSMRDRVPFTLGLLCLALSVSVAASDTTYNVVNKGSVLMGGGISIRNTVNAPQEWAYNAVNVNPRLMYFVAQNLALGADLNLNILDHVSRMFEFGFGPRIGYYFNKPAARAHPFIEMGLSYRTRNAGNGALGGAGVDVSAGIVTMIGSSWGTEAKIGYLWESLGQSGHGYTDGVFSVGAGLSAWAKSPKDLRK